MLNISCMRQKQPPVVLAALLVLGACVAPARFQVSGPPGKSDAALQADADFCNGIISSMRTRDPYSNFRGYFEQCMAGRGDTVQATDGGGTHPAQSGISSAAAAGQSPPTPETLESYRNIIDAAMQQESNAWASDKYNLGSLSNLEIWSKDPPALVRLRASFKYNGGSEGFLSADFNNSRLQCIGYPSISVFDASGGYLTANACHPPMTVEATRRAAVFRQKREVEAQRGGQQLLNDFRAHPQGTSASPDRYKSDCPPTIDWSGPRYTVDLSGYENPLAGTQRGWNLAKGCR